MDKLEDFFYYSSPNFGLNYSTCLLNIFFSFVDFELKRDLMLVLSKQRKFLITLKEFCKNLWKNQQGLKIMQCKLMKFK